MDESRERPDASTPSIASSGEEDAELLTLISWKAEHPVHAKDAWAEFYVRHAPFVYKVCFKAVSGTRFESQAEDLAADTMIRAYERAGTYQNDPSLDETRRRRRVRAWLAAIAENIFKDALRGRPLDQEVNLDSDRWPEFRALEEAEFVSVNPEVSDAVEDAFRTVLDSREVEVLRVTMQYYKVETKNQRLPNEVAENLARQLNTTSENLRKIRERAKTKVREFLVAKFGTNPFA